MSSTVHRRFPWLPAALLLAGAMAVVPAALAATSPAYPFKAKTAGFKTKDWSAQWWQWAYGTPESSSPLFDDTGPYAAIGQRGPVWFLCGAFNLSGTVTRTITIPAGKSLFFPVLAQEVDNLGSPSTTTDQLYSDAAAFVATVDLLVTTCTVDGVAITDLSKRRVISSVFEYTAGPGTIPVNEFGATAGEIVTKTVSDGYWVMLKPLTVGSHILHFGGAVTGPGAYTQDVTYNITVVATQ
jgi:hypothetical protein